MAIESGSTMLLRVDDTGTLKTLAAEISSEMNITADMIETTNKDTVDSNGNPVKTYIGGESGYTFSVEGLHDPSGDWNAYTIVERLQSGTVLTFQHGGVDTGDDYLSGSGLFNSLTLSTPKNEAPTVSAEIQGTGELVKATVAP